MFLENPTQSRELDVLTEEKERERIREHESDKEGAPCWVEVEFSWEKSKSDEYL